MATNTKKKKAPPDPPEDEDHDDDETGDEDDDSEESIEDVVRRVLGEVLPEVLGDDDDDETDDDETDDRKGKGAGKPKSAADQETIAYRAVRAAMDRLHREEKTDGRLAKIEAKLTEEAPAQVRRATRFMGWDREPKK